MWLLREDLRRGSNLGWAWKDEQVLERSRVGREHLDELGSSQGDVWTAQAEVGRRVLFGDGEMKGKSMGQEHHWEVKILLWQAQKE